MDEIFIPLPLRMLAVIVLAGGVLGIWRTRGRSATVKWIAVMLLLFGIAAIALMMMLAGG